MIITAIDPGPEVSAYVRYADGAILESGKIGNDVLRVAIMNGHGSNHLAIEMIVSYGMPVGREIFETCVWIGRFIDSYGDSFSYVYRREVKLHLCNSVRATDANVRAALIDLYGGRAKAIGTKAAPGPLHKIKADVWSALGVAVTYVAKQAIKLA